MKMERFCVIEPTDKIDKDALKIALTIDNPIYAAETRFAGGTEAPKTMSFFEEKDGNILIPRRFIADNKNDFWNFLDKNDNLSHIYDNPEHPENKIDIEFTTDPKLQLRSTQVEAMNAMADSHDLLHADCGSGKTVVMCGLICKTKLKTAVLVNQEFLAKQWKDSLLKFTNLKDEDITISAGELDGSGKVNIMLVQTLIRRSYESNKQFFDSHSLVIADEVHTSVGSFKFREAIEKFIGLRKGVTATIQRTDRLRVFMWAIGNRIYRMECDMLVPDVYFLPTELEIPRKNYAQWQKVNNQWIDKGENMPKLINILVGDDRRNAKIAKLVMSKAAAGRNIMVLTHRRQHTAKLYDLCDMIKIENKVIIVGGGGIDHPGSGEKEGKQVIFATFQYVRQALDIPKLDTIIFTTPFGARNDVQQAIGRILRQYPGKPKPEAYYIYDKPTMACMSRALAVQRHCRTLGYTIMRSIDKPVATQGATGRLTNDIMAKALKKAGVPHDR